MSDAPPVAVLLELTLYIGPITRFNQPSRLGTMFDICAHAVWINQQVTSCARTEYKCGDFVH